MMQQMPIAIVEHWSYLLIYLFILFLLVGIIAMPLTIETWIAYVARKKNTVHDPNKQKSINFFYWNKSPLLDSNSVVIIW